MQAPPSIDECPARTYSAQEHRMFRNGDTFASELEAGLRYVTHVHLSPSNCHSLMCTIVKRDDLRFGIQTEVSERGLR